jgi:ADP-ribosylglycohydrolase
VSAGNGAAQRAAPLGLFFAQAPQQRRMAAIQQAQITHRDNLAAAGAVVVAETLVEAIHSETIEPHALLEHLAQSVAGLDAGFAAHLSKLGECLALPPSEAARLLCSTAPPDPITSAPDGLPAHVVPTVLWALYAFLTAQQDFTQALMRAIYPGGDVAPAASIVGALAGGLLGLDRLPPLAARRLTNGGAAVYDYLVDLARACHETAERNRPTSPEERAV